MSWLRRRLITGFFVTVPLVASVVALVWVVQLIEGVTGGLLPGTIFGIATPPGLGIVVAVVVVLFVGILATNVLGRRLLAQTEALLLHVPVFRSIYSPLKQLTEAFSPDNETGFKRVVLVEQTPDVWTIGFLTKEFAIEERSSPRTLLAVYVPTNHLYLGNVVVCAPERVRFPELTVEQGIRIFLTGGMALPTHVSTAGAKPPEA